MLFCSMQCTEPNIVGVLSTTLYRFIEKKTSIEFLVRASIRNIYIPFVCKLHRGSLITTVPLEHFHCHTQKKNGVEKVSIFSSWLISELCDRKRRSEGMTKKNTPNEIRIYIVHIKVQSNAPITMALCCALAKVKRRSQMNDSAIPKFNAHKHIYNKFQKKKCVCVVSFHYV